MGFNKTVSDLHANIAQAMKKHRGKQLRTAEIVAAYVEEFPAAESDLDWVKPPDHAINTTNEGDCDHCAGTDRAIFRKIKHGTYEVL